MTSDEEIKQIIKKLEDHERRIENLEKLVKGGAKKVIPERKYISDHFTFLKSEGFFDQPRTITEIVEKLAKEGYHYSPQSVTAPLQRAVRKGVLGRIKKENKWAYCKR